MSAAPSLIASNASSGEYVISTDADSRRASDVLRRRWLWLVRAPPSSPSVSSWAAQHERLN